MGMHTKKMKYRHGGVKKMKMKDGGQALFDALKKKGYKKIGGTVSSEPSLLSKMSGGPMMDMSIPMEMKMKQMPGGGVVAAKMPRVKSEMTMAKYGKAMKKKK